MKKLFIGALSILFFASCGTDALKDLNINPQAPSTIDMNFLMTSAQLGTASGGSRETTGISTGVPISGCVHMLSNI